MTVIDLVVIATILVFVAGASYAFWKRAKNRLWWKVWMLFWMTFIALEAIGAPVGSTLSDMLADSIPANVTYSAILWGAVVALVHARELYARRKKQILKSERGQYFAERIYVWRLPNGKYCLNHYIDDENIPVGAMMAEYRFVLDQKIYKEEMAQWEAASDESLAHYNPRTNTIDAPSKDWLDDGFGNSVSVVCLRCGKPSMEIVRPGKVQCWACDGLPLRTR